jgi:hypothetical protein
VFDLLQSLPKFHIILTLDILPGWGGVERMLDLDLDLVCAALVQLPLMHRPESRVPPTSANRVCGTVYFMQVMLYEHAIAKLCGCFGKGSEVARCAAC